MIEVNYCGKVGYIYKVGELTEEERKRVKMKLSEVDVGDLYLTGDGYVVNIIDIYYKRIGGKYKKVIVIPGRHILYRKGLVIRLRSNIVRRKDYIFIVMITNGVNVEEASKQVYGNPKAYLKRINNEMLKILARRLKMDIKKTIANELKEMGIDEKVIAKEIAEAIKSKGSLKKWAIELYLSLMYEEENNNKKENLIQKIKLDYNLSN